MEDTEAHMADLRPTAYHAALVAHLKQREPDVWHWASSMGVLEQHVQDTRALLLRETYRLTPDSHGPAYAAGQLVMARLGLDATLTLYQGNDGAMNASLLFLPGEIHVVLHGPVLERLSDQEFIALLGHELAHYKLWSSEGGDFHTVERILAHTLADPAASASHAETARLYGLHTELYADRGAAVAAQSPLPAISALVKVQTGLVTVDPEAYLQQAIELESADSSTSKGQSHPESFLRAQAIHKWWHSDPTFDTWLRKRLHGPLAMDRLDLPDQVALSALTRRFIALFLQNEALRSERALTSARGYFPDWRDDEPRAALDEFGPDCLDDSVRGYLNFVMLDLALADPDAREPALVAAYGMARAIGSGDAFVEAVRRDTGLSKREVDKLVRSLPKQVRA